MRIVPLHMPKAERSGLAVAAHPQRLVKRLIGFTDA
jgi:hypothetical protein